MKIEVHLIQNFVPSCLNRDDTNTPKDCEFGGVRRARISSQCFKYAMREHFRKHAVVPVGKRTKLLKEKLLAVELTDLASPELSPALDVFLETYYSKMDGKAPNSTAVLLFLSPKEVEAAIACVRAEWEKLRPVGAARNQIAELIAGGMKADDARKKVKTPEYKSDKDVRAALESATRAADVALFGRMLAEKTNLNIDGSCQVAQAISTHAVNAETDFYAAVDELQGVGAGMLGVTGFNSACFYRYALLDFDALQHNVSDDQKLARDITREFLRAMVEAIPTGKQNSMGAHNAPTLGLFVVREGGMPMSLANAFATPVTAAPTDENGGLVTNSVDRLGRYWGKLAEVYGAEGVVKTPWFCLEESKVSALDANQKTTVRGAIDAVIGALPGAES